MQERQVTIEGTTRLLEPPFLVLATQNPIEYEGTYPLPEAQLDRFLLRLGVGYPGREEEWDVLERRIERAADEVGSPRSSTRDELLEMQRAVEDVTSTERRSLHGRPRRGDADASADPGRREPARLAGALKLSRCRAALDGRDYVVPEDVKAVAVPALAHRLTLRPELWMQRLRPDDIVAELLDPVPTPRPRKSPC